MQTGQYHSVELALRYYREDNMTLLG